jgi:hypothetical protein
MAGMVLKGIENAISNLHRIEERQVRGFLAACRLEAERVMTASQLEVPVEFGNLKNSKFLLVEATPDASRFIAGYATDYAVYVHEIPPPPMQSEGGRSATHVDGKWKYLEDPFKREAPHMIKRINDAIEAVTKKG